MLTKLLNSLLVLDTTTGEGTSKEIASNILKGIKSVGPWICGILAVVAVGITLMKLVQYVLAKNQGNDQGAEPAKKGIVWGIVAMVVFASFSLICGFIVDIANAFGANISADLALAFMNLRGLL